MAQSHDMHNESHHGKHPPLSMTNHNTDNSHGPINILTKIITFMLRKGVGRIWARLKVTRKIQEAKMTIGKWIKFRDKSENLSKQTLEERRARI